jgi:hypothetical protein
MFLNEFNQTPTSKIAKLNKMLSEQFGMKINPGTVNLDKLMKINETAKKALYKIRGSNKKFQLEPDYAKYLSLRDLSETMIVEGYYESSPGYKALSAKIDERITELCNSGYTSEEARSQCMNEVRADSTHCYDDDVTETMVMSAIGKFEESCGSKHESIEAELGLPETDMSPGLLRELAKEIGQELATMDDYNAIEEKLGIFAEVSGKSRDSVVGFLNGLEEDSIQGGIQMFGAKIAQRKLNDSIQYMYKLKGAGKSVSDIATELDMDPKEVIDAMSKTKDLEESDMKASMFDDILNDMLAEEVNVEEAEVVMAVRALADDIQDQVERIGRMVNEDLPAIADQMRQQMGADTAQSFSDASAQLLTAHLEACKAVKGGLDQSISGLTGGEMVGGLGDTADLGGDVVQDMGSELDNMGIEEPVADNIPAMAGPADEPLGRAEV